jgi:hypothetical protein
MRARSSALLLAAALTPASAAAQPVPAPPPTPPEASASTAGATPPPEPETPPRLAARGTRPPDLPAAAAAVPAILSLSLNGVARGDIYVYLEGESVLARTEDLRAAGLGALLGPRRLLEGLEYVSTSSFDEEVKSSVDLKEMTLRLEVDPRYLPETRLDLGVSEAPEDMVLGTDASMFLNYAASWHVMEDRKSVV